MSEINPAIDDASVRQQLHQGLPIPSPEDIATMSFPTLESLVAERPNGAGLTHEQMYAITLAALKYVIYGHGA